MIRRMESGHLFALSPQISASFLAAQMGSKKYFVEPDETEGILNRSNSSKPFHWSDAADVNFEMDLSEHLFGTECLK